MNNTSLPAYFPNTVTEAELLDAGNNYFAQGNYACAIASYRGAIKRNPGFGAAYSNLGLALEMLGRHDEATTCLNQALALNPGLLATHCALGNILQNLGRYAEAAALYVRALERFPQVADLHFSLGSALLALGQLADAESRLRRGLELAPNSATALNTLGVILREQGQLNESEICLLRALELSPEYAEAHLNLGASYVHLGRIAEAESSYQRALDIQPDSASAMVIIGETRAYQGQFSEAEKFYRRALALEPEMPEAWSALAGLRKMTAGDAAWLSTAEKIVDKNLRPTQEFDLRYAIGKYCDDVRDFDRAFLNFRRANELSKSFSDRYDRKLQALFCDQIILSYGREQVQALQNGASSSEQPLFIVGMPRSGTSLVEQIAAAHPAIFGAGELSFWADACRSHPATISSARHDESLLRNLASDYLQRLASFSSDALRVVDKMPVNFLHIGLIHAAFPRARIIHTLRNPVDTCLSIYFQNFSGAYGYANDLEDIAHYYRQYRRLMAHWRETLPPGVLLDVPYESLVSDPKTWSRKIIEFSGLDWSERCLEFHGAKRSVSTHSYWQVRQPIYKNSVERWRNYEKYLGPLREFLEPQHQDAK